MSKFMSGSWTIHGKAIVMQCVSDRQRDQARNTESQAKRMLVQLEKNQKSRIGHTISRPSENKINASF